MSDANTRLNKVAAILAERGKSRDMPRGERSMQKTCEIFTAITGHRLSVADGWRFMIALKLARMSAGKYKEDDYDDLIGYAALLAEEKFQENRPAEMVVIRANPHGIPLSGFPIQRCSHCQTQPCQCNLIK